MDMAMHACDMAMGIANREETAPSGLIHSGFKVAKAQKARMTRTCLGSPPPNKHVLGAPIDSTPTNPPVRTTRAAWPLPSPSVAILNVLSGSSSTSHRSPS
ncbi:hypothetical protein ACLB2K_061445 [Fragaria x ananassa]